MKINKDVLIKASIILIFIIVVLYNVVKSKENLEEFDDTNIFVKEISQENESKSEKIKVHITGEVNNPGVIELEENSRIEDAINLSGGVTNFANLSKVNLAYVLEDGQKVYIPNINEKEEKEYISKENGEKIIVEDISKSSSKVNINKASADELKSLSGVGDSLANRIINYRKENGKFKSIEDLKNVSGIGEKKFESIKEYIEI